jgi:hypothetical protein
MTEQISAPKTPFHTFLSSIAWLARFHARQIMNKRHRAQAAFAVAMSG